MIYGRPDPQEAAVLAVCTNCGGELYSGDTAYRSDGECICEDCMKDWLRSNQVVLGDDYDD